MKGRNNVPNPFLREIPFLVLLVFWAVYAGVEIFKGRFDIITSAVPVGIFILAYLAARWVFKYPGKRKS